MLLASVLVSEQKLGVSNIHVQILWCADTLMVDVKRIMMRRRQPESTLHAMYFEAGFYARSRSVGIILLASASDNIHRRQRRI